MTYEGNSVCSAWVTRDEFEQWVSRQDSALAEAIAEPAPEVEPAIVERALLTASDALYYLSGKQFPGVCEVVLNPDPCQCRNSRYIDLGVWPAHAVTQLIVGSTTLDPASYRVEQHRYLVNLGTDWQGGSFQITVQYGLEAPGLGKDACMALAVELLAGYIGQECALPDNLTSITRSGISMDVVNPADLIQQGRSGIYAVDRFLSIYNPKKLSSPPFLVSLDKNRPRYPAAGQNFYFDMPGSTWWR